jgi:sugar lactone lactonase YvrE
MVCFLGPTLKPNLTVDVKLGVNGLHVRDGYLYFDNTLQSPLLVRLPYHVENATVAVLVEVIFEIAIFPLNEDNDQADGFTFDDKGNTWLSSASSRVVTLISRKGRRLSLPEGPTMLYFWVAHPPRSVALTMIVMCFTQQPMVEFEI